MRRRNPRVATVGVVLFVLAIAFYVGMMSLAPQSNNPAELGRVVGTVSGLVGGLALAMVLGGLVGRKVAAPVRAR